MLAILERHPDGASLNHLVICEELQCSERVLQYAVTSLRRDGHPVLRDGNGYHLAQSADEVRAYAAALRRRAQEMLEVADALIASVEETGGGDGDN